MLQFATMHSSLQRSYSTNRAPLVLTLNADFLQLNEENTGMRALEKCGLALSEAVSPILMSILDLLKFYNSTEYILRVTRKRLPVNYD